MNAPVFDPFDYEVRIARVTMDGEVLYRARVDELPDLEVYMADSASAIEEAVAIIAELHAAAAEQKRPFPKPIKRPEEEEYSGRITFRTTPMLHRQLAAQAERDNVSLNLAINMLLMHSTTIKEMVAEMVENFAPSLSPARVLVNTVAKYPGVLRADPVHDIGALAGIVKDHTTMAYMQSYFHAHGEIPLEPVYPTTQRVPVEGAHFSVEVLHPGLLQGEEVIARARLTAANATPVPRVNRPPRGKHTHG